MELKNRLTVLPRPGVLCIQDQNHQLYIGWKIYTYLKSINKATRNCIQIFFSDLICARSSRIEKFTNWMIRQSVYLKHEKNVSK